MKHQPYKMIKFECYEANIAQEIMDLLDKIHIPFKIKFVVNEKDFIMKFRINLRTLSEDKKEKLDRLIIIFDVYNICMLEEDNK